MLNYETPKVEFIWFESEDILTTSIVAPPDNPNPDEWE